ncbi:MAG: GntP family permease [Bacteroidota bacterium]
MNSLTQITGALVIALGLLIALGRWWKVPAFFGLLAAALCFGWLTGQHTTAILEAAQRGFGAMLQQIGLLVAVGCCLGVMLEKTRAMETISHQLLGWFGTRYTVLAMAVMGAVVGIPVFCDSGFIILSRLIPSIASQATVAPAQLTLALASGLYTSHTLIPPTPGPLASAAALGLTSQLGVVVAVAALTSVPTIAVAYAGARWLGKDVQFMHVPDASKSTVGLPSGLAWVPLLTPIVLIGAGTLAPWPAAKIWGHPVVALLAGWLLSFFLLPPSEKSHWPSWHADALKDAGVILLVTGAGGAFGMVIKNSGIDGALATFISEHPTHGAWFLVVAFTIAAVMKTAQGSTTSAIVISSAMLAPLAGSAGIGAPAQLAALMVAIGGGSMAVSHANDSYFWVVSQFGGIDPNAAARSFTVLTLLLGLTTLLTSIVLFLIL